MDDRPKISIGMPIFNGEEFLCKKMDSILSQTHQNFELIISDNCSTDSSSEICKNYAKKDNRIKFIQQQNNIGLYNNLVFVLEQANCDFFAWTAADDIMLPEFLEKNIDVLLSKKNAICCMSNVEFYGNPPNKFQKINASLKKYKIAFRPFKHVPISGEYEKKIRIFLKNMPWYLIYGVFKTNILRKCIPRKSIVGFDGVILLDILEHGDIEVLNEVLFKYYTGGTQSKGMRDIARTFNDDPIGKISPYYPWLAYFRKRWGWKLFLKNVDLLIRLNYDGIFLIMIELLEKIKKVIFDRL